MVLYSPHAVSQMSEPDRDVSQRDVDETLRYPDSTYPSRLGRTVAEKAFEGYVIRVVYIVEDAPVAIEKYRQAMEKERPGYLESIKGRLEQPGLLENLEAAEAQERPITTIVTVIRMRRRTRRGGL